MSDVLLCVVRGVINVNKFEVSLLPSSHLILRHFFGGGGESTQPNTNNNVLQHFPKSPAYYTPR